MSWQTQEPVLRPVEGPLRRISQELIHVEGLECLTGNRHNDDRDRNNKNVDKLLAFDRRIGRVIRQLGNESEEQGEEQNDRSAS